jgi:single-strand DNA-binding protein
MAQDTQVTLCGYVAKEPMFKTFDNGTSFAKFRMAFTERRRDRQTGEWSDGATTFLAVKCFRRLAENVAGSLRKGEPVMVSGRMYTHEYTSGDGQKRSELQVDASSIGHDLNRGVAIFSRTRKAAGGTALEAAAAGPAGPADAAEAEDYGSDAAPGGLDPLDAAGVADSDVPDTEVADTEVAGSETGTAAGGVVDESAVAEFAKELDESLPGERGAALPGEGDAAPAEGQKVGAG